MAFRADETARVNCEEALRYLVPRNLTGEERQRSEDAVLDLIDMCGPVVDAYPSWHPLVSKNQDERCPHICPSAYCGYNGLDHTIYFVNGFVSCPYTDGQEIIDSVEAFPSSSIHHITAERLDVQLYNTSSTPILVRCHWGQALASDGTIPKSLAVALMLESEIPCWRNAELAETWETMRPYFLGKPYGSRSSLFVNQEAGQALKKVWNTVINTGMFGPIKV